MIKIAGSVSKGWLAQQIGACFDRRYYFDPMHRHAVDRACNEHVRRVFGTLPVWYTESNLGRLEYSSPDQVLVGGIQPNMIVGMLLGADFLPAAEADADISARCLEGRDVAALPEPHSLLKHALIVQFDDQIRAVREESENRLQPIPPFFWDASGRAAVHGSVTSGLKFLGDDFLLSMVVDAHHCRQLIAWLTEVSLVLVEHFAAVAQVPLAGIHIGECASCMLDEQNFRRFVVPAASQLGQRLGALRFHSCGRSDHVLDACRDIVGLTSLDVGGETSVAIIRELLGREFPVGIAPLVDHMTADSPTSLLEWYRHVVEENDEGDLTIGYHLEASYRREHILALHEAVERDQAADR